jgi:hypothetical protein
MLISLSVKDRMWSSLFGALMLSMVLGLGACSSGGSDSDDDSNSGGGGDFAPPSPGQACSAGNACDFTVQLSDQPDQLQNTASWTQQEFSYVHGFNGAPEQLTGKDYSWRSKSAEGTLFNYLQTTNFTDYNPLSASPPTALYVRDEKGISNAMTLQYANQTLVGISSGEGYWFFDLTTPPFTLNPNKAPYQFTVHSYDSTGAQNRELAVWLSSEYLTQGTTYTSVTQLKNNGAKNHWMVADDSHIAYVGGLFDFAKSNPNGFNLNLDTDLDGKVMNLSTTYALFYVSNGVPADCVSSPSSCTLDFIGQYTTPVTGKIVIAGSGRINGYDLLSETYPGKYSDYPNQDTQAWINMAQYRVNSGLIELSSSYNDGFNGPAIDIAGITVGFSPKRGDSSVLLNNRYLPMLTLEEAIAANGTPTANDQPVKVYDFKMVGNWVDAADGLEVHGRNSRLTYTYLHIADDSMKVSADNLTYEQTTVLQGDVQTGGLINIGSYGTGRPIPNGANVDGVYAHRITHKPGNCDCTGADCNTSVGFCGAALVASPTCQYGNDMKNVTITQLRVNNLGDDSSSVNKPFNIGFGDSYGSGSPCGNGTLTNVENLLFTDFKIFINPQSDSSIFNRGAGGGLLEPIGFYDGVNSTDVGGKVAIYPEANSFAYFICGNDNATQCWNTNGEGQGTLSNVEYSSPGFTGINFPYGP